VTGSRHLRGPYFFRLCSYPARVWKYLREYLVGLRYRRAIFIEEHGPRTCRALIQGKDISAHGPPAKWETSGFESFDIIGDHISPGNIIRHTAISLFGCTTGPIRSPARETGGYRTSGGRPRPARMCKRKPQEGGGVLDRIGLEGEGGTGTTHRQTTVASGGGGNPWGFEPPLRVEECVSVEHRGQTRSADRS